MGEGLRAEAASLSVLTETVGPVLRTVGEVLRTLKIRLRSHMLCGSNPLMAARVPYNDIQDKAMPTLLASAYLDRATTETARATMTQREAKKFRSLSQFLTADKSEPRPLCFVSDFAP